MVSLQNPINPLWSVRQLFQDEILFIFESTESGSPSMRGYYLVFMTFYPLIYSCIYLHTQQTRASTRRQLYNNKASTHNVRSVL